MLTPNFTASQTAGEPSIITLTDTSTGSDVQITTRRVYFRTALGDFLVEDGTSTEYEVWDYALPSSDFDVLDKDYALVIVVQWVNSIGAALYTKEIAYGFTLYNEDFDYGLTQQMAANPNLVNDSFYPNKGKLRTLIDSGNQAVTYSSDTYAAQMCYDEATNMRLNQNTFF